MHKLEICITLSRVHRHLVDPVIMETVPGGHFWQGFEDASGLKWFTGQSMVSGPLEIVIESRNDMKDYATLVFEMMTS